MFWYENDVKQLERIHENLGYDAYTIFYGSSSIRLWKELYNDFADIKPVNLGFGGSTLAACVWFFDRIMVNYRPKRIIIYVGDNDLGDGRTPEEVFIFFQQLVVKVNRHFGDIPCYFVSLKPSLSRWHIVDRFRFTNLLIENEIKKYNNNWHYIDIFNKMLTPEGFPKNEYFVTDGLHLSEKGYLLWKNVITEYIEQYH